MAELTIVVLVGSWGAGGLADGIRVVAGLEFTLEDLDLMRLLPDSSIVFDSALVFVPGTRV